MTIKKKNKKYPLPSLETSKRRLLGLILDNEMLEYVGRNLIKSHFYHYGIAFRMHVSLAL